MSLYLWQSPATLHVTQLLCVTTHPVCHSHCESPPILYVTVLVWVTRYTVCYCTGVSHHISCMLLYWCESSDMLYVTVLVWVTRYTVCYCTGVSHQIYCMLLHWCESPDILYVTVLVWVTRYPVCYCTGVSHQISCMLLYWCVTRYPVCYCTGVSHQIYCMLLYWCESPDILYVTVLVWVTRYPVCYCTGVSPDILYVTVLVWVTRYPVCQFLSPCATHYLFCVLQYWYAVTAWRVRTSLSHCTGRYRFQPPSVTRGTTTRVETATEIHKFLWGPMHLSGISLFLFLQPDIIYKKKGKAIPVEDLTVPRGWGSQISRHPAHEGGKIVSPTHWPPLSQVNTPGIHFC
jgi:hypothetical protein